VYCANFVFFLYLFKGNRKCGFSTWLSCLGFIICSLSCIIYCFISTKKMMMMMCFWANKLVIVCLMCLEKIRWAFQFFFRRAWCNLQVKPCDSCLSALIPALTFTFTCTVPYLLPFTFRCAQTAQTPARPWLSGE